jgi:hypothetical protein
MLLPLGRLAVGLETIPFFDQKRRHRASAHAMLLLLQFFRQLACTLAGPPQWRFRVAACHRIDQGVQGFQQRGIRFRHPFATGTHAPHTLTDRSSRARLPLLPFANTLRNGVACQARGLGGQRDTAPTQRDCFTGRPLSPNPFIHYWIKGCEFLSNPFERVCVMHPHSIQNTAGGHKTNLLKLYLRGS